MRCAITCLDSGAGSKSRSMVSSIGVEVVIPPLLRRHTGGQEVVKITLDSGIMFNVDACLDRLVERFPGVRQKLYNEQGELARYVYVFVNGAKVSRDDLLKDGDEIIILFAVAGG